jgi:AraC-like DNA-binding protein
LIVQICWTNGFHRGILGFGMDLFDPPAPSDPLGEALHHLRMSGAFYCRTELTAPWGLTLPPLPDYLWFHIVTAGSLRLEGSDGSVTLGPGDLALVTHGGGHVLRSEPGAPAPGVLELDRIEVSDRYEILRHGGGGAPTRLMCGAVRFDHPAARHLVGALPGLIRIEALGGLETERMQGTLGLIAAETARPRPGGEAVITRLADVLVIQAIRAWIETDPDARTGWLGAMRDPQIGRALAAIHADPATPWTVGALASEVAMSRSAFAARFTELVGEPAMQYTTRVRMQLAVNALRDDGATVAELAERLGYRSQAAFARAFKREVGVAPGAIKRAPGDPLAAQVGAAHSPKEPYLISAPVR